MTERIFLLAQRDSAKRIFSQYLLPPPPTPLFPRLAREPFTASMNVFYDPALNTEIKC